MAPSWAENAKAAKKAHSPKDRLASTPNTQNPHRKTPFFDRFEIVLCFVPDIFSVGPEMGLLVEEGGGCSWAAAAPRRLQNLKEMESRKLEI